MKKYKIISIIFCVISIVFATYWIPLMTISFMGWLLMAVEVFVIAMIVILVINLVVSRKKIKNVISFIKH